MSSPARDLRSLAAQRSGAAAPGPRRVRRGAPTEYQRGLQGGVVGARGQGPSPAPREVQSPLRYATELGINFEHWCFACGHANPSGMRVDIAVADGHVEARYVVRREHTGYEDTVHGGVLSTLLDEVMAWAVFLHLGTWGVTTRLASTFRRPVGVGEELRVIARVERDRGRVVELSAEARRASDGERVAEGSGSYVKMPEAKVRELIAKYGDPQPIRAILRRSGAAGQSPSPAPPSR